MKVHFIAIGGSAMHNLAIALHQKGINVSGSDDEIFDPARSRLQQHGLLPPAEGWHPERITPDLDAIVLGMHAHKDNPELLRAQELGLKIYSYPEYLYEQSKDKLRIVVGGSHGKTTTTAIILHVLQHCGIEADFMVGAQLKGFDVMVRLSNTAKIMVIEGDEYLTSPIDRRPKFHLYHPNVAIVTGIEWDHINVFPTFDIYRDQFARFVQLIEPSACSAYPVPPTLIYCNEDPNVRLVAQEGRHQGLVQLPYSCPDHRVEGGTTWLGNTPLRVFGHHNLLNLEAARLACRQVGVTDELFMQAVSNFEGAAKRLELVHHKADCALYKDFAHAPSKLRATIQAMRQQYPERQLVACIELHTYSSLSQQFLDQYRHTMDLAHTALVYYSHHALQLKNLPPLYPEQVRQAFGGNVEVFTDSSALVARLRQMGWHNANLLMMSSGNFDGIDFDRLAEELGI
ncbi:MAG: peptidoglycan synthetase [Bacteroidales bacterium]|nr:peptidoglycan synthetase [Bacteroidales bacterium]